jgi:hypothetical protein
MSQMKQPPLDPNQSEGYHKVVSPKYQDLIGNKIRDIAAVSGVVDRANISPLIYSRVTGIAVVDNLLQDLIPTSNLHNAVSQSDIDRLYIKNTHGDAKAQLNAKSKDSTLTRIA